MLPQASIVDLTGLWAVADPEAGTHFLRLRLSPCGTTFEGVKIGEGPVDSGQLFPDRTVEWSVENFRCRGQLDPSGWFIKQGSYSHQASGIEVGKFTAMRQHERRPDDAAARDVEMTPQEADRSKFAFQDWADGLFFSIDRAGCEQLLDADGIQVMMDGNNPTWKFAQIGWKLMQTATCWRLALVADTVPTVSKRLAHGHTPSLSARKQCSFVSGLGLPIGRTFESLREHGNIGCLGWAPSTGYFLMTTESPVAQTKKCG